MIMKCFMAPEAGTDYTDGDWMDADSYKEKNDNKIDNNNNGGYGETSQPETYKGKETPSDNGETSQPDSYKGKETPGDNGETSGPKRYEGEEKVEQEQNHVENGTCDEEPEVKVEETVIGAGQSEKEKNNGHCR